MPKKSWRFPDFVGGGANNIMQGKAVLDDDTLRPNAATTLHVSITRPLGQTPELTGVFVLVFAIGPDAVTVDGGLIAAMPAVTIEPGETQDYIFNILNTGTTSPVNYLLLIGVLWPTGGGVDFRLVPGPA